MKKAVFVILVIFLTSCVSISNENIVGNWDGLENQRKYRVTFEANGSGVATIINDSGKVLEQRPFIWKKASMGIEVSEYIVVDIESLFHVYLMNVRRARGKVFLSSEKYKFNYYRMRNA